MTEPTDHPEAVEAVAAVDEASSTDTPPEASVAPTAEVITATDDAAEAAPAENPQHADPATLATDSVAAVTDAPEATTDAPEATTDAPEATTAAPEATTDAPEATTDAPEAEGTTPGEETPGADQAGDEDAGAAPSDVDIVALARRAQELQAEWNAVGFAGREVEAELGPLFRKYLQVVFDRQRQQVGRKIDARRQLVTRAKELAARAEGADASALNGLIREAKALQAEWKAGEPAPRGPENSSWQRFSGALSTIFALRRELQDSAKGEREQILAQVIQLGQSKDPFRAQRELGGLLTRWRKAPPVSGQAYGELKARLDQEVTKIRERVNVEQARRDAEDKKSQAERAKWAARVVKEAQRTQPQRRRDERPRPSGGEGGSALAAALAAATTGRRDEVAAEVARLETTLQDLRARLAAVETGAAPQHSETVDTDQGFTIVNAIDRGADNPVRIRAEIERAEGALARRTAELADIDASTKGLGIGSSS